MKTLVFLIPIFIAGVYAAPQTNVSEPKDNNAAVRNHILDSLKEAGPILNWIFHLRPSSKENAEIAQLVFPNSWIDRILAIWFGDNLKIMRNNIIERVAKGDTPLAAFVAAYLTPENWVLDPKADFHEQDDPFRR